MRRPPMKPRKFHLDAATETLLRERARAHGVSQAALVRSLINGHRPGAEPGTEVAIADGWYDSRPPARRVSVAKNHAGHLFTNNRRDPDDQMTIFDGGTPLGSDQDGSEGR